MTGGRPVDPDRQTLDRTPAECYRRAPHHELPPTLQTLGREPKWAHRLSGANAGLRGGSELGWRQRDLELLPAPRGGDPASIDA